MEGRGSFILWLLFLNAYLGVSFCSDEPHNTELSNQNVRYVRNTGDLMQSSISKGKDNNKPIFTNCYKYEPTVKEEEPVGTYVITVNATDVDPLDSGGKLTYNFVLRDGQKNKFKINNETGEITTGIKFDRDEPIMDKEVYVIVQATDNGRPTLADVCTIKITIEDINDNPPTFNKGVNSESVPQDLPIGREVMRISATDIDDGNNSIVSYFFSSNSVNDYFDIDEGSGVITLKKSLSTINVNDVFKLQVQARDNSIKPLTSDTEIQIKVVDSNKKAPSFVKVPLEPIVLPENFNDYDSSIANITAISNMDNKDLQFVMETGRTEQTNKHNIFVMASEGDTAYIKLGRALDYEFIVEYTLTIRVQNKDTLNAVTKINIKVTDVNDNIPAFTEVLSGTVLENEEPGTPVMQVQAIDLDGTEANNIVNYDLADHTDLFQIDPHTGNITTKDKFDRETKQVYHVKVVAKDNSPSSLKKNLNQPNSAEQVFRITIEDKNDNAPKFNRKTYIAERILESTDKHKQVIEVTATDKDSASVISYSITSGNTGDAFSIEEKTGKIRVKNNLDYETVKSYNLTVEAFDGKYTDTAIVHILIENVNDNLPVFKSFVNDTTIDEESEVEGCLVTVVAYDPDIDDPNAPQNIVYSIKPVTDGDLLFLSIDNGGCVRLIKTLDRDPPTGSTNWQAIIIATDQNGESGSQQQTETLVIHLKDINDNAPQLDITEVVWYENKPANKEPIIKLTATDNDLSTINGPPFTYSVADNASREILDSFQIEGDNLYAIVEFDREYKKEYIVPIEILDSGTPTMKGLSYLKVIIGDVNDNAMKPGSSEIFVNKVKNMPDVRIGRVYVEDPDDWDLPDKQFTWIDGTINEYEAIDVNGNRANFKLDDDTGNITILTDSDPGIYHLKFIVHEKMLLMQQHSVETNVTVIVKEIPPEAIIRSGSIRFHGTSAENFIKLHNDQDSKESLESVMHKQLSAILNVTVANLDIISVLHSPVQRNMSLLDVRFAAHGSPYYLPEKLNTITTLSQEKLRLGNDDVHIQMVGISECMMENTCPGFSCTNFLNISNTPYVVNTNRTSFVGVSAIVEPKCTCYVEEPFLCYNGGTPLENSVCNCLDGFDGPHCELISIGFKADGWALYPTFDTCNNSELTLELETEQKNGLVFYIGPLKKNPMLPVKDFMSLELQNGYPVLLVDYGNGTIKMEYNYTMISDGASHFIYINFQPNSIEMRVDKCHMSACIKLADPKGSNKALNVNGPLQLGGAIVNLKHLSSEMGWKFVPTDQGFYGVVRNLTYNGKVYNLGSPSYYKNIHQEWSVRIVSNASFGIDSNFLVALLVCIAILLILLLAVVVHRRRQENWSEKDMDDIRENIINYEDEGGGEVDTGFDLDVLRRENYSDDPIKKQTDNLYGRTPDHVPDISGFLEDKKESCDKDPDFNPFDDVRYYAYEGDGNTSRSSLSSLASCTDEGDLKFNYLSNFGPRFRKLADMYGEEPSDDDPDAAEESWC